MSNLAPYDLLGDLARLKNRCKYISRALETTGWPTPRSATPGFDALIRIIAGQQVSTAAANGIWAKVTKACDGKVTAARLLALGEAGLRASGFSGQKARYALGLAEAVANGALDFKALARATDDDVRTTLTAFKGVGNWTADIYLMFCMGRGDVWPAADLGLQAGLQMLHARETRPSAKETEQIAETWRPHRSSAAILLWHYYDATRDKAKTAAPKPVKKAKPKRVKVKAGTAKTRKTKSIKAKSVKTAKAKRKTRRG